MTSSLRACLAAESWKRLYPEGQQNTGRSKSKNILTYEDFARDSFKVSPAYAKQALAILNHSPELLEKLLVGQLYNQRKKVKENNLKQNAPKDQIDPSEDTAAKVKMTLAWNPPPKK